MTIIGIDIGGSTTKIIGLRDGVPMSPIHVKATDPITSVFGAFGKYISINGMPLSEISKVIVTGVGASFIKENIYNIETVHIDEFKAIGLGGLYLSNLNKAIIVSMGTGTAFVHADGKTIKHLGGTGVGGGTLLGLSYRLLNMRNFDSIVKLAAEGNLKNVDLTIADISTVNVSQMPAETTASNFGKISDYATNPDIALGIVNLVFQTIGMMAAFVCRIDKTKDVVLCGNLTNVPDSKSFFKSIEELWDINFIVPQNAEYATALGAALAYCEDN